MCAAYSPYHFHVLKQQLMRFFQDKHIKVSLFIQDGVQSLDGTIYLNFADEGPAFSQRPGRVTYFNGQEGDQLKLFHSDNWTHSLFTKKLQGTANPHLGINLYAENRDKPPVPLRPAEEAKNKPEAKSIKAQVSQSEQKKVFKEEDFDTRGSSQVKNEFNALAELLGNHQSQDEEEFKMNLFPEPVEAAGGFGGRFDDNIIEINLQKD